MFKRIDKISNEEWIGIVLIAAVIGVVFFKVLEKTDHKKTVLSDYSITTGSIIEYRIWGDGPNTSVTYEYKVNGNSYQRSINSPKRYYSECDEKYSKMSR
jgi:hypothetical protein